MTTRAGRIVELKAILDGSHLPKRTQLWAFKQLRKANKKNFEDWSYTIRNLISEKVPVKTLRDVKTYRRNANQREVVLSYRIFQEADDATLEKSINQRKGQAKDHEFTIYDGEKYLEDWNGVRTITVPASYVAKEPTHTLVIEGADTRNDKGYWEHREIRRAKFFVGTFEKNETDGNLQRLQKVAKHTDELSGLDQASHYKCLIEVVKVESMPQQNRPVESLANSPLGEWTMVASKHIPQSLNLDADSWDDALELNHYVENGCMLQAVFNLWAEPINAYLDDHPNATKFVRVSFESIWMICKNGRPRTRGEGGGWLNPIPYPGDNNLTENDRISFNEVERVQLYFLADYSRSDKWAGWRSRSCLYQVQVFPS